MLGFPVFDKNAAWAGFATTGNACCRSHNAESRFSAEEFKPE